MSERIEAYKAKITEARQRLDEVLDSVGDRWDETLYSEGAEWRIRDVALHLMIADIGHNHMIMGIAEGKEVIPENYDLERYNRRSVEKQAERTLDEIRQSLNHSRQELLTWLDSIDESVLDKEGRHANMQIIPISQILDILAGHERIHAEDIAKHLSGEST